MRATGGSASLFGAGGLTERLALRQEAGTKVGLVTELAVPLP